MSSSTSHPIPTTDGADAGGSSSTSLSRGSHTDTLTSSSFSSTREPSSGTLSTPPLIRGHSDVCEMNQDREHASLDKWAEETGKSMKQKEQLWQYEEDAEAKLGELKGGVYVGGRKMKEVPSPRSNPTESHGGEARK